MQARLRKTLQVVWECALVHSSSPCLCLLDHCSILLGRGTGRANRPWFCSGSLITRGISSPATNVIAFHLLWGAWSRISTYHGFIPFDPISSELIDFLCHPCLHLPSPQQFKSTLCSCCTQFCTTSTQLGAVGSALLFAETQQIRDCPILLISHYMASWHRIKEDAVIWYWLKLYITYIIIHLIIHRYIVSWLFMRSSWHATCIKSAVFESSSARRSKVRRRAVRFNHQRSEATGSSCSSRLQIQWNCWKCLSENRLEVWSLEVNYVNSEVVLSFRCYRWIAQMCQWQSNDNDGAEARPMAVGAFARVLFLPMAWNHRRLRRELTLPLHRSKMTWDATASCESGHKVSCGQL